MYNTDDTCTCTFTCIMYMYINGIVFSVQCILIPVSNRQQFFDIVSKETQDHFKISLDKLLKHLIISDSALIDDNVRSLFFGDYMSPGADPRIYDEIMDFEKLTTTIER